MSAIFMEDAYTSRTDSATNISKRQRIIDSTKELTAQKHCGEYQVEWNIRDGTIQDISCSKSTTWACGEPLGSDMQMIEEKLDKLHDETLVVGFHGSAGVKWIVTEHGTIIQAKAWSRKNIR